MKIMRFLFCTLFLTLACTVTMAQPMRVKPPLHKNPTPVTHVNPSKPVKTTSRLNPQLALTPEWSRILYAGYDNIIYINLPNNESQNLQVTINYGSISSKGNGKFVARPSTPGGETVITVSAKTEGRVQEVGKFTFRVRKLPDPTGFLNCVDSKGSPYRFRGGKLSKQILMNTDGIGAAVDDGILNIPFRVQGFETVFFDNMGNALPYVSNDSHFSAQQKNMFRSLGRGKRFYVSKIRAIGPDGVERLLDAVMEIIVN